MGLLSEGNPLTWEETKALAEHVRDHGIQQFINLYQRFKDRQGDAFKWGDEVEYIVLKFDDNKTQAQVALKAQALLEQLNEKEFADPEGVKSLWRPEYAAFMIEGMPGKPYVGLKDLKLVEANMRYRREEVTELLAKDECVMSITNFPRLGCKDFSYPVYAANPPKPLYFPLEAIYPGHPRYQTATNNILKRRGEKLAIKIKVFKDKYTKLPATNNQPLEANIIELDTTGFGMGCCCLQITFQACNVTEARSLYDQLAPLCPIMLAFTAASPIYAGYLTESDCRWNILSAAVDCRTAEERGVRPLKVNKFRIAKSRYDSIDSYLSPEGEAYNDVPVTYEDKYYQRLRKVGIDHLLAQHIAHLFVRDSICLFSEKVHQNDEEDTDHFENIQSTNWQTMRFKPPPPQNSSIGWRVEFRPCETQMSDFENAAIVCFMSLLTRVILSYKLDFLTPISKVDENMQKAQKRDACRQEKFWFRKTMKKSRKQVNDGIPKTNGCTNGKINGDMNGVTNGNNGNHHYIDLDYLLNGSENNTTTRNSVNYKYTIPNSCVNGSTYGKTNDSNGNHECHSHDDELELMSIAEIFNGKHDVFPGLIPLVRRYLQSMEVDAETYYIIEQYLKFIEKRASGELKTTATWMREQVLKHPDYKKDSIVSDRINYDILKKIQSIQKKQKVKPPLKQRARGKQTKIEDIMPLIVQNNLDGFCRSK